MADDAAKKKAISDWINRPYAAYTAHVEKQCRFFKISRRTLSGNAEIMRLRDLLGRVLIKAAGNVRFWG
jgi:hypothetical protein